MRTNRHARPILRLLFLLGLVSIATGQAKTDLSGRVADRFGAVIPGARVTLVSPNGTSQETRTNNDGVFLFSGLAPGSYEVGIEWGGIGRVVKKKVEVTPNRANRMSISLDLQPCSGIEGDKSYQLTEHDRAEIIQQLLSFAMKGDVGSGLQASAGISIADFLLVPDNIKAEWLTSEQQKRIKIMTRAQIQDVTERLGGLTYLSIPKFKQHASCVETTILMNVTVKGQLEDANMAGGGATYEFVKTDGHWAGRFFAAWVV